MKILMIDDDNELLLSIGRSRSLQAIITEECHSATEAIVAIMTYNPDVVLLDHQLSDNGNEGYDILDYIRRNGLRVKVYSTTRNDTHKKKYQEMGIEWIDKSHLAALRNIVHS